MRKDLLKESFLYILLSIALAVVILIVVKTIGLVPITLIIFCVGFFFVGIVLIILGLLKRKTIRYKPLKRQLL